MKNAVVTEAYISGATKMEPAIVEGAGARAIVEVLILNPCSILLFCVVPAAFLLTFRFRHGFGFADVVSVVWYLLCCLLFCPKDDLWGRLRESNHYCVL